MKKMAVLEIDPRAFRELLQLPDGAEIIDLRVNIDRRGMLEVKIQGAGWNTVAGAVIPHAIGTVTVDAVGNRVIDWGFPPDA